MIKAYYWKGKPNFGDLLTPLLLKRFCNLSSEWSDSSAAHLIGVGSILEKLDNDRCYIIAGSGFLKEGSKRENGRDWILGLRGPLSLKRIKVPSSNSGIVLADPGLLADELVPLEDKVHDLGIVSHWSDTTLSLNPTFLKYKPLIINVADDPLKVISQIGKCKKIVSSSLHGIILADAFGIPRRIEIPPLALEKPHQEGGLFKWMDYSASIGMKLEIGITQEPNRHIITDKQHELFDVFKEVKSIFAANAF